MKELLFTVSDQEVLLWTSSGGMPRTQHPLAEEYVRCASGGHQAVYFYQREMQFMYFEDAPQ